MPVKTSNTRRSLDQAHLLEIVRAMLGTLNPLHVAHQMIGLEHKHSVQNQPPSVCLHCLPLKWTHMMRILRQNWMSWWKHPPNPTPIQVPLHQRREQSASFNMPSKRNRPHRGTDVKNAVLSWIVCMNSRYTTRQATIFCIVLHANNLSTTLCHYQDMNMNIKRRTCNALSVIGHSRSRVRLKLTCIHTAPSQVSSACTQNVVRDFSMRAISPGILKDIMAESTNVLTALIVTRTKETTTPTGSVIAE